MIRGYRTSLHGMSFSLELLLEYSNEIEVSFPLREIDVVNYLWLGHVTKFLHLTTA